MKLNKNMIGTFLILLILLLPLIFGYNFTVQDCSLINNLSYNNITEAFSGGVFLNCVNRTIDIPINITNYYYNITNLTEIRINGTYITNVTNVTNITYVIVNITNGTYVQNITNNITQTINNYLNSTDGVIRSELDSILNEYVRLDDNWNMSLVGNITSDIQDLKDKTSTLGFLNIFSIIAIILSCIAIGVVGWAYMGSRQQ